MIVTYTAYGVALTTEFGNFYKPFKGFSNLKPHSGYDNEDDEEYDFDFPHLSMEDFCASCPSADDYQFVLGFNVNITKTMNIEAIHEHWLKYMDNLPPEIKTIVAEIRKTNPDALDPDFQFMAGKC